MDVRVPLFLVVLVVSLTLFPLERMFELRSVEAGNVRFNMPDVGFLLAAPLHDVLRSNETLHNALAIANTLYVVACYIFLVFVYKGGILRANPCPGTVLMGIAVYVLRFFVGCVTQMPLPEDYLYSPFDFPDIMFGANTLFQPFYSGHCAIAAVCMAALWAERRMLPFWVCALLNVLQCIRMLATRGHYSMDLVMGTVVGLWLFSYIERVGRWCNRVCNGDWVARDDAKRA